MEKIIQQVRDERQRQDDIHGVASQRGFRPAEWLMILGEEVGEANQAALEEHFAQKFSGKIPDLSDYREELIQVAAVAIAAIEDLDAQGK